MKIGIIGASLAGLVTGEKLAKAGHNVTVITNNNPMGGRLATYHRGNEFFDYGISYLIKESDKCNDLMGFAEDQGLLTKWADEIPTYDGSNPYKLKPYIREDECFVSKEGFSAIVEPLKRWVDIKDTGKARGLTYFGNNRGKKRPWMINLSDYNVFECDAVILATSAVEAYGYLQTAQDETASLRLIRRLDEVKYNPRVVLMGAYDHEIPDWKAIECKGSSLAWLCNDSSKNGENEKQANITLFSSEQFAEQHAKMDEEGVKELLLKEAAKVTSEKWVGQTEWNKVHRWNYYEAINPIDDFYMELEMKDAPLALTGNYFKGNSLGAEYHSAIKLSDYWIEKYENAVEASA